MPVVAAKEFLDRLGRSKQRAVLLQGSDLFWRDLCRVKLVEAYIAEGARDWAVSRFSLNETSLDAILQQAQTLPMLSPRQVVFISDLEALERKGEAAREAIVKQLDTYFADPAPFTLLVFEAAQLDQRMKLSKLLAEHALVVDLDVGGASPEMIVALASSLGVTIERDAADLLDQLAAGKLARVRIELQKLATYVGERGRITPAEVNELVLSAKTYSVWELADVLASGQRGRALKFLDSVLRDGEPAPAIVGALAWMFRKLLEAQELSRGASQWDAARILGMRPEQAQLALDRSRRIPRERLRAGLIALAEADNRLKLGGADQRAVMEFLLAQLTARETKMARV